jgi:hypothetical protein
VRPLLQKVDDMMQTLNTMYEPVSVSQAPALVFPSTLFEFGGSIDPMVGENSTFFSDFSLCSEGFDGFDMVSTIQV